MTVRVLGVRHHSPACARLVARAIAHGRPAAVLIEGPADFNARLGELMLQQHRLPLALYSYANGEEGLSAQCWFPFLDYSPEWVALRAAQAQGALLRFIDLPHWQYRARTDARSPRRAGDVPRGRSRYARAVAALCREFGSDGDNALWDSLFEAPLEDDLLQERLDRYFHELRGDDAGSEEDQARELQMARWIAWAARQVAGDVLVVCGGWHKRALESLWPQQQVAEEPVTPAPSDPLRAGSYLVPYTFRQVDALGGYWSGMQSPLYYQWVWERGLEQASERGLAQIVKRLRGKQVVLSTADLVALRQAMAGLAQLRGRAAPLRGDLLDALQASVVKEALEAPPPWVDQGLLGPQHHPVLREALLALTGEGGGSLDPATPMPPLVHDAAARLAACGLAPNPAGEKLVLDRREPEGTRRAELLWQLHLVGVQGARLTDTRAPHAARHLPDALRFEEHWWLQRDDRWEPDLIEAAAWGAMVEAAARQRLSQQVRQGAGDVAAAAQALLQAVRAGLHDMGQELGAQLQRAIPACHELRPLAVAARSLLEVVHAGFWGRDTRPLLEQSLAVMAERLLELMEDRSGGDPASIEGDVAAATVLDTMLRHGLAGATGGERTVLLDALLRLARAAATPPALRGACLAVAYAHDALGDDAAGQVLTLVRGVPPRDALGDFLYGLFSCARALATGNDEIVAAVHDALAGMSNEDFLVALPQLRAAFTWFPPRERSALAARVAGLLGLSGQEQAKLLVLRSGPEAMLDARAVEAQALAWAKELGVLS